MPAPSLLDNDTKYQQSLSLYVTVVTMKGTLATPATILRHMVPVPTLPLSFGLATLMQLDVQWEIVLVCPDHDAASR